MVVRSPYRKMTVVMSRKRLFCLFRTSVAPSQSNKRPAAHPSIHQPSRKHLQQPLPLKAAQDQTSTNPVAAPAAAAAAAAPAAAAPPAAAMWGSLGLRWDNKFFKNGLRKYGRTGIVTYLGLSTMVTTGFYIAIERNVDVKKLVGIKDDDPDQEPGLLQKVLLGPGSHIALAVICSKAMIPIKLPVALALTPYVHRLEQRFFQRAVQQASSRSSSGGGSSGSSSQGS